MGDPNKSGSAKAWVLTAFLWAAFGGGLVAVSMTGCATATVTSNYSPTTQYRKVVVVGIEGDPRRVQPKVVSRFQAMGFDVEVISPDTPTKERQGSGFIVSGNGDVLTCAHVVGEQKTATVWLNGERFYADVASIDTNLDAALLKLDLPATNSVQALRFASSQGLQMGQDVYTIGFPLSDILGKSPRLTKGLVSSTVGLEDDPKSLQISAEVQAGSSGSPLLDENGNVVGMVDATLNVLSVLRRTGGSLPQNVNFALKADSLGGFLKQAGVEFAQTNASAEAKQPFDVIKDSVVLVRAGRVLLGEEDEAKLLCRFSYRYLWDMYWRLPIFYVELYDSKTGKLLLKAGQYADNLATEDATINQTFQKIRAKLLPVSPSPGQ
jgi:hypothetical protein